MAAAFGGIVPPMLYVREGGQIRIGKQNHISSVAAVASPRTAARDKLLSSEGDYSVPAVTALYFYLSFVNEYHFKPQSKKGSRLSIAPRAKVTSDRRAGTSGMSAPTRR